MKMGVLINHMNQPLGEVIERARLAEKCGAGSIWLTQTAGQREIGMLLSALAANTGNVQLGMAVQPVYAHPPVVTAQTALTLDEFSGGRLILGLGVGHRVMGEWMMGGRYTPQAEAMREYLTTVRSLVTEGEVNFAGRYYSGHATYVAPRRPDLPLYMGALGPRMLELAGEVADGVVVYMSSPAYLREQVMPRLRAGWARRPGGRPDGFDVVVMLFSSVCDDDEVRLYREWFRRWLAGYQCMDNYRKLFTMAGFAQEGRASDAMVSELAAIGRAEQVSQRVSEYREAGATRMIIFPMEGGQPDPAQFASVLDAAAADPADSREHPGPALLRARISTGKEQP
jgi:alkanesulfonate monooxygenase SsuD/methylene tetrahydromethanopterin reductase-like flavin-dependent oxidoreductase (luciferase family)